MKAKAIKAKIVAAALVSTALVLISLNAGSGSLDPDLPPGPTMHTLEEIYTAVTSSSKIDGVDGESVDDKHKDWIDVLTWAWAVSGPSPPGSGGNTNAEAKEFVIKKWVDKSSPLLYLACCQGRNYPYMTLSIVEPTGERGEYLQFKLENVFITNVSGPGSGSPSPTTVGGSDRPHEEIALYYSKVEWTHTVLDSNGVPTTAGTTTTGFDFMTSTP
jgi:type VI secretion system secreted protein Hcp